PSSAGYLGTPRTRLARSRDTSGSFRLVAAHRGVGRLRRWGGGGLGFARAALCSGLLRGGALRGAALRSRLLRGSLLRSSALRRLLRGGALRRAALRSCLLRGSLLRLGDLGG